MPVAAAVAAMGFIQVGASIIKGLFPAVGAQGATLLRLGVASLVMLAIWRPWRSRAAGLPWRWICAYGISLGCMNSVFYASLSRIPLGIAVSLEFVGPLGVALMSSRRAMDFIWVLLAAAGILLLMPTGITGQRVDPVGVALALGAGFFWALYIIFGKRAGSGGSGPAVAYGSCIATLAVLPFGLAQAAHGVLEPGVLPAAIAVAMLSSAIPYSLEMGAMTRLPARTFGVLMSVEPGIGAAVGYALLGERLAPLQLLAIGCIIAASVGSVRSHAVASAADSALHE